jgi:tRNA 2-thiocytidine biosynthesis protein TtcA
MNAPLPEGLTLTPEVDPADDAATQAKRERKIAFENNKLDKRLHRLVGKAIDDFNMIEDGDRVMVCLSGGKDSYAMLDILMTLPFHIETQDTYSIVKRNIPEGKTLCSLCSRLRRGILYRVAGELKCTKIALGHHRDDILATTFLNMFYGGRMKGMPPKLVSDDGKNIVIRPLAYVAESDLIRNAEIKQYPIIPCNLCGSQENLKRREMINMIRAWEKSHPGRVDNAFNALSRITLSHMLDPTHYDFKNLKTTGSPFAGGDVAFDDEPCADPADAQVIALTRFED